MQLRTRLVLPLILASWGTLLVPAGASSPPDRDILAYISRAWHTLQRSVTNPAAYQDPKVTGPATLYLPHGFAVPPAVQKLHEEHAIPLAHLPRRITRLGDVRPSELARPGLLYVPHPYVVPGGMFNEMYGWDSYFIIRGLLMAKEVGLARGMVENWLFEVEHYGAILNANRTYYLTRSQPPFLAPAIRALHQSRPDRAWLVRVYPIAVREHRTWTTAPHLAGDTGLSRYFDVGEGPIPEMGAHENYYQQVVSWLLTHPGAADYLRFEKAKDLPTYSLEVSDSHGKATPRPVHLARDYFKGDRAMRASGFDVSFRFGPFSGATHHYAPVCLNSLLYRAERDLAWMARTLGRSAEAGAWETAAARRAVTMRKLMWSESAGLFQDYDFTLGKQSRYAYATTFYPLWAGVATPAQAALVARRLPLFEKAHGLAMSPLRTGAQWDLPFGWAPVHLLAVEGLLRCGQARDALRLARKFNDTVRRNFLRDGTIREKYDMETGSSEARIGVGYTENVVGFGWTNGVYLVFEELLRARSSSPGLRRTPGRPVSVRTHPREINSRASKAAVHSAPNGVWCTGSAR